MVSGTGCPTMSHEDRVAMIEGVLTGAFFSPLHVTDLFGFLCGQEGLLGLEEDEVFDLFIRGAIAAETIFPEVVEGRDPLAWLMSLENVAPVGAHALASLRHDRPFLFHRLLYFLPMVRDGRLNPKEFEYVEDFLKKAMADQLDLRLAAETEIEGVRASGMILSGLNEDDVPSEVGETVDRLLVATNPDLARTDTDLVLWLSRKGGLRDIRPDLAGPVMVEAWSRWVGAVVGCRPDMNLLVHLMPSLGINAAELALHVPPEREAQHTITACCPYCGNQAALELGPTVTPKSECEHLVFVGTSDELHLLQALKHCDLGGDFLELLTNYYHSPSDLDLFSQVVNDLFEMVSHQGRLRLAPVACDTSPKGFYYLRAYFTGPPELETTCH